MQLRRSLVRATAALALAAPLTSCGFDYATDRYYTPAHGANDRDGVVDVLNAVVVSTEAGSGTFVASLANNSSEEAQALSELAGEGLTVAEFQPVEIPAGGLVNLAEPATDIKVEGDFEAGDFIPVELGFESGERTTLDVPVVPNSGDYAGLDGEPAPVEEPTETEESH
ncbi:hypothetical protein DDE18_02915 [Nocardioides gansuensis]|uniref:Copper chaperone PCu(A)C n=1 Tax=Nocardioides gansuensis TaxID=2138300 RepID=A0A2T8FFT9_9ACTN|nr:hypothetical protein [Nocardioides gansuensis]PVG84569.1 hypothetical protein DDE18_02915 [Nocardioides gansuensis]